VPYEHLKNPPFFTWCLLFFGDGKYQYATLNFEFGIKIKTLMITFEMRPYPIFGFHIFAHNEYISKIMLINSSGVVMGNLKGLELPP
jgi:hypothetical protein